MEEQNGVKNEQIKSPIMLRNSVSDTVELPIQINQTPAAAPVASAPAAPVTSAPQAAPVVKQVNVQSAPIASASTQEEILKENLPAFGIGLMSMLLIATYIFSLKFFEPAGNLILTAGILNYPFTFLITSLICTKYSFKVARKSIYMSAILYALFIFIMMISIIPSGNEISMQYNAIVQYLFANNQGHILGIRVFYPTLGQFFGVLVSFIISHLLFATVYNAVRHYTIDYLAVGLSLFIGYIIDRIIFIFLLFAKGLYKGNNTFDFVIKVLTTEFMGCILACVLLIILYAIISKFKPKKRTA